tara:strand:+ start:957 stop:2279 length:1323 start_codon:yes stop_codon:yes gene_type:complete
MELSSDQTKALDAFRQHKNIFITGPGGSGKSVLIRRLVEEAETDGRVVQVCALTGCAAVLLQCKGAKTIHSWAGIGIGNGDQHTIVDRVNKNKHKRKAWTSVDVLIIDEISMMSMKLFNVLDRIGRKTRKCLDIPFGGIQVVFSGDFYQLPPVGNEEEPETSAFCFESENWKSTFEETIQLTTMFRQTDPVYAKVLNQIRIGTISKKGMRILNERVGAICDDELIKPTILLPRRRDADVINKRELDKLTTEERRFALVPHWEPTTGNTTSNSSSKAVSDEQRANEIKYLSTNITAEEELILKVGTQVMCVANVDMEGPTPLVNGSQGVVVGFENMMPIVQFRGGVIRKVGPHLWESENVKGVGVKQIPLIHAWAITIHKSQGVTLELAQIDVGSSIFECGQTYVALSRVKSVNGLFLTAFDIQKIKINRRVKNFYASLES